ncbi:MAG: hypothetical protein JSU69_00300 [Candidatus Zixiibacteriota bacterium]|nr:MAG: hypothetical protein JSU69_00300 [candidate division Zixibacteria bacterium]
MSFEIPDLKPFSELVIDFGTENAISSSSAKVRPDGPVRRRGVLPLAILGTEDFEVTQVDASTVTLQGASPIQWNCDDVSTPVYEPTEDCECRDLGADGYLDLFLKFDILEIINSLGEISPRK